MISANEPLDSYNPNPESTIGTIQSILQIVLDASVYSFTLTIQIANLLFEAITKALAVWFMSEYIKDMMRILLSGDPNTILFILAITLIFSACMCYLGHNKYNKVDFTSTIISDATFSLINSIQYSFIVGICIASGMIALLPLLPIGSYLIGSIPLAILGEELTDILLCSSLATVLCIWSYFRAINKGQEIWHDNKHPEDCNDASATTGYWDFSNNSFVLPATVTAVAPAATDTDTATATATATAVIQY